MKRFEFPLESVLRLRRFAEAQARTALQEALAVRNEAEAALAATRAEIAANMALLGERLSELSAAQVVGAWSDLDALEAYALKQEAWLADCELKVAQRQSEYLAAQQERKPLERMKEEMQTTHARETDLAEQALHDELAVITHSRKGGEP